MITRNATGSVTLPCAVCRVRFTIQRGTYLKRLGISRSGWLYCSKSCSAQWRTVHHKPEVVYIHPAMP